MPSLATKKKAKGKGKAKGSGKRGGKGKAKKVATGDGWADGDCYHQLRFTLSADFEDDTLYVAMAAPYSYTQLQTRLAWIETSPFATRRLLCKSLGGRRLDVLTITEPPCLKQSIDYSPSTPWTSSNTTGC